MKINLDIAKLASDSACFDLQFRKDVRRERTNSPTYYRWKVQFVITGPKEKAKLLEKVKKEIGCGRVHVAKNQARFSVQNVGHISGFVVPFFNKNKLYGNKKKDFELWQKAVDIICKNKDKHLAEWNKGELLSLVHIHKSSSKYKNNPREPKWIEMAQSITKQKTA